MPTPPSLTQPNDIQLKAIITSCPLTTPNGNTPPNTPPSPNRHGDDALWVDLWPENKILIEPKQMNVDGSISVKFGWYRGTRGQLTIEGRRLDAAAPPLQADILDGYGESGFQASGIRFPSEGCWEITGSVNDAKLTFVTLVISIPYEILRPVWSPEALILIHESSDVSDLPRSILIVYGSPSGGQVNFETGQSIREIAIPYPDTAKEPIIVNGGLGTCVQGAWDKQGRWKANVDAGALEWSSNGLSYRISYSGLQLRCEDLLRMAGSPP
ncbi:MAG TPA: hypothetical protein VJM08_01945 [Anaerolineales bacterium]|nr:hypothetical protein [Anaerolineales bacterium]